MCCMPKKIQLKENSVVISIGLSQLLELRNKSNDESVVFNFKNKAVIICA